MHPVIVPDMQCFIRCLFPLGDELAHWIFGIKLLSQILIGENCFLIKFQHFVPKMKQANLLWLADEAQVQADVEEREGFWSCRKWSIMQMVNK
jgi:hypothetical protein